MFKTLYRVLGHHILGSSEGLIRIVADEELETDEWQQLLTDEVNIVRPTIKGGIRVWHTSRYPYAHLLDAQKPREWKDIVEKDGRRYTVSFHYRFGTRDMLWMLDEADPIVAEIVVG